ncbi:MAG TPA: glycosyltransferase family 39 protein, partial [Schlesneria sp.]
MPPSPSPKKQASPSRAEFLWLAAALVLGASLRFGYHDRMAIEHFDEGVYASNFWFGPEEGYEYPARHLYAPPLLPAMIEWTMIIASLCGVRPTGFVPMIPSLLAGLATIPSIWWVGRRWFGPSAGIVSAWFVAASDFHSSYSRAALTDVPVCLFILWGAYFVWQALQSGSRRDIILAALFTALAWWTKYNGWLPLAVGISGAAAWQFTQPRADRRLIEVGKRWLLVSGLSFLLWSPVLIGLQKHGGYGVVAANHGQYIEGLSNWPTNAARQLANIAAYEDVLGPYLQGHSRHPVIVLLNWLAPLLVLTGSIGACFVLLMRQDSRMTRTGCWPLLAWISGLTLATPCYHPYPRLVMPWMVALWLGVGLIAQLIVDRGWLKLKPPNVLSDWRPQWFEIVLTLGLVLGVSMGERLAWENHGVLLDGLKLFRAQIKEAASQAGIPDDEAIVYVYAAPAVVFHLRSNGLPLAIPVPNFDFANS